MDAMGWLNQLFQRVFQRIQKQLRLGLCLYRLRAGSQAESVTCETSSPLCFPAEIL